MGLTTKYSTKSRFVFSMAVILIGAILGQLNFPEASEKNDTLTQSTIE